MIAPSLLSVKATLLAEMLVAALATVLTLALQALPLALELLLLLPPPPRVPQVTLEREARDKVPRRELELVPEPAPVPQVTNDPVLAAFADKHLRP